MASTHSGQSVAGMRSSVGGCRVSSERPRVGCSALSASTIRPQGSVESCKGRVPRRLVRHTPVSARLESPRAGTEANKGPFV